MADDLTVRFALASYALMDVEAVLKRSVWNEHPQAKALLGSIRAMFGVLADLAALEEKFNPSQERDAHGRWASDGRSSDTVLSAAAGSADAVKREIGLIVKGVALTAAVELGVALAPEASATFVGAKVVQFAAATATGMLQKAAGMAALQIVKGMGVDTSGVERVAATINSYIKSSASDGVIIDAIRPHLAAVADQACAQLNTEMRAKYPGSANLELAANGIRNAYGDFKRKLALGNDADATVA